MVLLFSVLFVLGCLTLIINNIFRSGTFDRIDLSDAKPEKGGYFTITAKHDLSQLPVGSVIGESDFTTQSGDHFIQMQYTEEDKDRERPKYDVKPGTWVINKSMAGYFLESAQFTKDEVMEEFNESAEIEEKVDCFFNGQDVYKELGIEVPKRTAFVYGPPGTGKTTKIISSTSKYVADGKTARVLWPTDKFEAYEVKDFVRTFNYVEGVEKLIFILEDLGGVEMEEARMRSDPSLLSLLDNKEKTFTIPVMIIATTNHPEMFLANLTNRPERIDDKIKVGFPKSESRTALYKFFVGKTKRITVTDEALSLIGSKKCESFTPAHIKDVVVRAMLHKKAPEQVINEMIKEIEEFKKAFAENGGAMGFR